MDDALQEKMFYGITEVSRLVGVPPYILRYWETEFHEINPHKDKGGIRRYRKKDIDAILRIKQLLYEKKYTVKGAKNVFKLEREGRQVPAEDKNKLILSKVKNELAELKKHLEKMQK